MKKYLPVSIDLEKLTKDPGMNQIKEFHPDKLKWILAEVAEKPITPSGFAGIHSTRFKSYVHNYKKYLDFLSTSGVIEIDMSYSYELYHKVRGYRFTKKYSSTITGIDINYLPIVKRSSKEKAYKLYTSRKNSHLVRWFNPNLIIDCENAVDYLGVYNSEMKKEFDFLKEEESRIKDTWYDNYIEKLFALNQCNLKNPYDSYKRAFISIDKIKNQDFSLSTDSTVHRFHSILTMMPSDFRNFLSYDGKELVCLDIRNSQAYFSLGLLEEKNIEEILNVSIDLNKKCYKYYNKSCTPPANYPSSSIILAESLQRIDILEVERYKDLVLSGKIYEYFEQAVRDELGITFQSRKALKAEFFRIIYSSNKFLNQPMAAPKRVFQNHFPGISEYFAHLKKLYPDIIPILLQRWESHAVLQGITKKIFLEHPDVPLFTIHDAIATTVENAELLSTIICEELKRLTSYKPQINREEWTIKNLKYYDKWKLNQI